MFLLGRFPEGIARTRSSSPRGLSLYRRFKLSSLAAEISPVDRRGFNARTSVVRSMPIDDASSAVPSPGRCPTNTSIAIETRLTPPRRGAGHKRGTASLRRAGPQSSSRHQERQAATWRVGSVMRDYGRSSPPASRGSAPAAPEFDAAWQHDFRLYACTRIPAMRVNSKTEQIFQELAASVLMVRF